MSRATRSIGLGCMRLSTVETRDDAAARAVIHAALDAGATLLDTADAYALNDHDTGHNERLVAEALRTWSGDRERIRVATKGGLRRPGGRWVPDGRAKHLRAACEASRRALGVDVIDLYQLHVPDPRVPLETSVRALASLHGDGLVRAVGLCNVTVAQIEAARAIVPIAAVQVELGIHEDAALRGGVAAYCRDHGIELIAYRPLGGVRSSRLARDPDLRTVAERHGATPHTVALAWLLDLDPGVLPIPGATRPETARAFADALALTLDDADRAILDRRAPAGRILRVPLTRRRPRDDAPGEVVLVMGMPSAGKSTHAERLEHEGYARLNRDARGGRVADLVDALDEGLAAGTVRWVLDNTYPTRAARNAVVECAWRHGVPVRCVLLDTPIGDAQINAIERMMDAYGGLPMPETLRERGRSDSRFFGPDAQFRWQRAAEPPVLDEGFTRIDTVPFERSLRYDRTGRGLFVDAADVAQPAVRDRMRAAHAEGWHIVALAWSPDEPSGPALPDGLGFEIDLRVCPHPAGPPICWCRPPLPGLLLAAVRDHGLDPGRSLLLGRSPAARTMADRVGLPFETLLPADSTT